MQIGKRVDQPFVRLIDDSENDDRRDRKGQDQQCTAVRGPIPDGLHHDRRGNRNNQEQRPAAEGLDGAIRANRSSARRRPRRGAAGRTAQGRSRGPGCRAAATAGHGARNGARLPEPVRIVRCRAHPRGGLPRCTVRPPDGRTDRVNRSGRRDRPVPPVAGWAWRRIR